MWFRYGKFFRAINSIERRPCAKHYCETTMRNIRKHIKDIIIIALLITCIAILCMVVKDINELYKHIDILNLFYRNLEVGLPV